MANNAEAMVVILMPYDHVLMFPTRIASQLLSEMRVVERRYNAQIADYEYLSSTKRPEIQLVSEAEMAVMALASKIDKP